MNRKVVKTCIIVCWCILASCMIFKLCGSTAFDIAVKDERFIGICNWLDTDGKFCLYVLGFTMSITSNTFILLASSLEPKPTPKHLALLECVNIPVWFVKFFFPKIGFGVECVMLIVLPAIISKKWWSGFLGLALNMMFQVCSLYIRGQELAIFSDNTVLALIMSIDYYIMVALYYMYVVLIKNKNKEVTA